MSATERLEQLRDFAAAHELLDSGTMTAAVSDLDDYLQFCTKHLRAPMPGHQRGAGAGAVGVGEAAAGSGVAREDRRRTHAVPGHDPGGELPGEARGAGSGADADRAVGVGGRGPVRLRAPAGALAVLQGRSEADARLLARRRAGRSDHRDHTVLSGLAERITDRRHEVALVAMLEHRAATGKVVNNRSDAALYGALGRARTARTDGNLSVRSAPAGRPGVACRARCAPAPWWSRERASATGETRCTI